MKDYLTQAIRLLKPNSEFVYTDNDYSTIDWIVLNGDAPTQSEIDAAIEQVKVDEIAEVATKAAEKAALLERLGITQEEANLLLG
jgi:hypothetical protein